MQAPQTIVIAAIIAIIQSLCAIGFGFFLVFQDITKGQAPDVLSDASSSQWVGTGTAVFIAVVFGFIIAASIALLKGARWGRGGIVLVQFILAASSFQMMSGGAIALGVAVLASALMVLYLLLIAPASVQWLRSTF
ncbi:hypothetical protein H0194_08380 [Corynebacterium incognita]|uniref:Uncharacterized protein n=1 Tax=Corynebacterium incognita TaxID=2754725 RepID=A0A7G7CSL8_9CORY|nr:hypothetical protein H0194_08380 [Corynebacterium incognita]